MVLVAMLDRFLHRSLVSKIDGDNYRMGTHWARSENLRKGEAQGCQAESVTTHPAGNWGVSVIEIGEVSEKSAAVSPIDPL